MKITVTKTFDNGIVEIETKIFSGKNKDKESFLYLKKIHDTKMNEATKKAGINKNFSNSIIFSNRDGYKYNNNNYHKIEKNINYKLSVKIENETNFQSEIF